ncbi:hypothetical protein T03_10221 [Trichinella britovi]|uniref:Uncharacterized protein n=1 Tax=Trichinella britovi TaxID=45882 RepID=A0A0V1D804_TRIBR|nr:hypothetical protein T03_10221 [Trichinella britovi]
MLYIPFVISVWTSGSTVLRPWSLAVIHTIAIIRKSSRTVLIFRNIPCTVNTGHVAHSEASFRKGVFFNSSSIKHVVQSALAFGAHSFSIADSGRIALFSEVMLRTANAAYVAHSVAVFRKGGLCKSSSIM